jgi:hypothetical protein
MVAAVVVAEVAAEAAAAAEVSAAEVAADPAEVDSAAAARGHRHPSVARHRSAVAARAPVAAAVFRVLQAEPLAPAALDRAAE